MQQSLTLRRQMRDTINEDIAARTRAHQAKLARLRAARTALAAAAAPAPATPLVMLAHGDSWFDYPLSGNDLSLGSTDIIVQLGSLGTTPPVILNMSHHGDASTDEMGVSKQERLIEALQDPDNWVGGKPDAILFSAGGNDVAGEQFCIFLDYAVPGASGLDAARFQEALGMVEASYQDLFLFRDRYAPGVPIFAHCYDFPIPNGAHPDCVGPWLKPSLDYAGWNVAQGTAIVRQALTDFKAMLAALAADQKNNFTLVDTQGVLAPADWANELHPFPAGFKALAERFVAALQASFPGRI